MIPRQLQAGAHAQGHASIGQQRAPMGGRRNSCRGPLPIGLTHRASSTHAPGLWLGRILTCLLHGVLCGARWGFWTGRRRSDGLPPHLQAAGYTAQAVCSLCLPLCPSAPCPGKCLKDARAAAARCLAPPPSVLTSVQTPSASALPLRSKLIKLALKDGHRKSGDDDVFATSSVAASKGSDRAALTR